MAAIDAYLATTNPNPTRFTRAQTADQIIKRVERGRVTRDAITNYPLAHR